MIDAVLYPLLTGQSSIAALVGTNVFPVVFPQGFDSFPALTYHVVGMHEDPTFQTAGMNRYRVQFDCWALTYAAASALRSALVASLNGFTGAVNGVNIQNARVLQPIDFYEHEALQFRLAVEFYITCNS
jgi:hypothetical protein